MDEREWLAARFEENRTRLRAVAYRMLGSLAEAEDAVQEAWLRLSRSDTTGIENLEGWLTTVVARVCLNVLHSRTTRREEPLEPHVPDPIVSREDRIDPEQEVLLADSASPCSWCSRRCPPPSGSPSSSTTPSTSPSTRSRSSCGVRGSGTAAREPRAQAGQGSGARSRP